MKFKRLKRDRLFFDGGPENITLLSLLYGFVFVLDLDRNSREKNDGNYFTEGNFND